MNSGISCACINVYKFSLLILVIDLFFLYGMLQQSRQRESLNAIAWFIQK